MLQLHIRNIRLIQLPPKPPRRKHRRQREIEFCIRQIQPRALPTPLAERHDVFLQPGIREEAIWIECSRVGKEGGAIVDEDGCHAYGCHGGDGVGLVLENCVGEEALEAVRDAVPDAETFLDDGAEVGESFQLAPFGAAVSFGH